MRKTSNSVWSTLDWLAVNKSEDQLKLESECTGYGNRQILAKEKDGKIGIIWRDHGDWITGYNPEYPHQQFYPVEWMSLEDLPE